LVSPAQLKDRPSSFEVSFSFGQLVQASTRVPVLSGLPPAGLGVSFQSSDHHRPPSLPTRRKVPSLLQADTSTLEQFNAASWRTKPHRSQKS
jgi:hypothetical protein